MITMHVVRIVNLLQLNKMQKYYRNAVAKGDRTRTAKSSYNNDGTIKPNGYQGKRYDPNYKGKQQANTTSASTNKNQQDSKNKRKYDNIKSSKRKNPTIARTSTQCNRQFNSTQANHKTKCRNKKSL